MTSQSGGRSNNTTTSFSSDGRRNPTTRTSPTGAVTTMAYADPNNLFAPSRMTNPQGNATTYTYDAKGNMATVTDSTAQQGRTTLTRNPNGTVATSKDPNGNITSYGYDTHGNLTTITPPAPMGQTSITHDSLSRVISVRDGAGKTNKYAYDQLDRTTQIKLADNPSAGYTFNTVRYTYDSAGNVTAQSDDAGTRSYTYDRLERLVSQAYGFQDTISYGYDGVGNMTTLTDSSGTITYTYNSVNLVSRITEPGGNATTFAYDADNNRTSTSYPNSVVQTAAFDMANQLTRIEGKKGLSVLTRFVYTYTRPGTTADTGLRQTVTDPYGAKTTYTYDQLDRLTRARTTNSAGSQTADYQYGYDKANNRTSEVVNGATMSATFNAANQLSARGGIGYTYDAAGNWLGTTGSNGWQLLYNDANQTTSMRRPGRSEVAASYTGPNQAQRTGLGGQSFTDSRLDIINDGASRYTRDANGGLVGARTSATARSYYLFDGLGSIAAVTNSAGAITNRYTYDPYGSTNEQTYTGAISNPWRYTGQHYDAGTGLYRMDHRYYQPELGRWAQPDPIGSMLTGCSSPDGKNHYAYVMADPVNASDPSGLISCPTVVNTLFGLVCGLGWGAACTLACTALGFAGGLPGFYCAVGCSALAALSCTAVGAQLVDYACG